MKNKSIYIFLFLSFIAQSIFAQAEFKTTVSKSKLGVNERLRIVFSINKQGADNFSPPNFKNFNVVAGPSQSVNQSWINGRVTFSQSYTYFITPKAIGKFTIPEATIQLNGKTLKSNSVKVNVLKAIEIPPNPNDPNYIAQQNVHLVAEISKTRPYVGEGIYVEYKLYVSENISVNDFSVTESPQYNGFWNQDIKINNLQIKSGVYNGEKYRYVVLRKALLIPTKSGKLEVEPLKMNILIGVPTGRGDFFGNPITRNITKVFASTKRNITVKELPLENKPENFNGAVGDFDFKITSNRNDLKANESSQIKVAVTGKGNLKLFEIPKIETPKELEIYTPEHKESVRTTLNGIQGSIYDLYTVVPQYKGKYKIPKVAFSYFNPREKKYKTITTEDLFVNVLEGKEIETITNNNIKKDVAITGANFRYIQTKSTFKPIEKEDFFKSNLFYIFLLLPLLTIPIGIVIYNTSAKKNSDLVGVKQRKADRLARKYLSEAKKQLGKKEEFYIALEKALHNYLKGKLQIETSEISRENIIEILQSKNVDNETINSFIAVLNDCDFARYTPITEVMMQDEFEKAKEVITALDKQL
ncbi:MAG: BatD family protein [Polaribacter sp.]|jgi:ribosomal protein L12E/L44/L45/RPP1/RPP2|nr:BatD family protein [Polaribacter sp.]MDG1954057.1 BatD family protein [Polaribacter sp.]